MVNKGSVSLAVAPLAHDCPACDFSQINRVRFSRLSAKTVLRLRHAADNRIGQQIDFICHGGQQFLQRGQIFWKAIGKRFGIDASPNGSLVVRCGRIAPSCCLLRVCCYARFRRGPVCRRAPICRFRKLLNHKAPPLPLRRQQCPARLEMSQKPRPRQP